MLRKDQDYWVTLQGGLGYALGTALTALGHQGEQRCMGRDKLSVSASFYSICIGNCKK